MNPKTLNILLKHAGWFSRKPKVEPPQMKPIWETDPTWEDDRDRVNDWYNGDGLWNAYAPEFDDNDRHRLNRMDSEKYYGLLNKHKLGYVDDLDNYANAKEDRKIIKKVLELIKKKQAGGIGPEAYKYWLNRIPQDGVDELYNYLYDPDWIWDVHDRPVILKDDSLKEDLKKIIPYVEMD